MLLGVTLAHLVEATVGVHVELAVARVAVHPRPIQGRVNRHVKIELIVIRSEELVVLPWGTVKAP